MVQSVGRVMRTAPGKRYGYIVIPVIIPAGITPKEALDDSDRFKVVWTVLTPSAPTTTEHEAKLSLYGIEHNRRKA